MTVCPSADLTYIPPLVAQLRAVVAEVPVVGEPGELRDGTLTGMCVRCFEAAEGRRAV